MTAIDIRSPAVPAGSAFASPAVGVALLFVVMAALLSAVGSQLLLDPDSWWHVAVGREIVAAGAFPATDSFSHTFFGAPWIAKEWLSQLLLYAAYAAGGWAGVATLAAITIALAFALLFGWLLGRMRWTVALGLTVLVAALAAPHFLARPHIFSWPLLVVWLAGLVRAAETGRPPSWWLLPVVVLWTNLHASVLLAFAIALPLGLEATLRAAARDRLMVFGRWALFGVAALAASVVSPYGVQPLLIAIDLSAGVESLAFITEWQPIKLDAMGLLAAGLFLATLAALSLRLRENLLRVILVLFVAYMAARHNRFVSLFAIVSVLTAAGAIGRLFPAVAVDTVKAGFRPMAAGVAAAGIAVAIAVNLVLSPTPAARTSPIAALAAARAAGIAQGNVFNSYTFGGFLIFEGVTTFIDGRSDQLFLGGFFAGMEAALADEDHAAFRDLLERSDVSWALVDPASSAARHLVALTGWREVYRDGIAVVFARS